LDALEWAVYEGCELGVTSHVIDKRIDAGRILKKVIIPKYQDDSLVDLSLRYETQVDLIHESIEIISNYPIEQFQLIGKGEGKVFTKMPPELRAQLPILLAQRLRDCF
jgi:phosphoribosylglycinamide formyltransferase-1